MPTKQVSAYAAWPKGLAQELFNIEKLLGGLEPCRNRAWQDGKFFCSNILQTAEKFLQEKKYHMDMDKLTSF